VDAAWGPSGTWPDGRQQICYSRGAGEPFVATGVAVDVKAAAAAVASITVNSVQTWGLATVPYNLSVAVISFELATDMSDPARARYSQDMRLALSFHPSAPCTDTGRMDIGTKILRLDAALDGTLLVDDVREMFGPTAQVPADQVHTVCFSEDGGATWAGTAHSLVSRTGIVKLSLNNAFVNFGLGVTIPSGLQDNRLAFHHFPQSNPTLNRAPEAGDTLALIDLRGDCNEPSDNPAAISAGASGPLVAPAADGAFPSDEMARQLGTFQFQVSPCACAKWL